MERADLEHWRAKEVARLFALLDTERRYYQDIVSGIPVGLVILSSDLVVRSANRFFRHLFGYRSEDVLRRTIDQVPPIAGLRNHLEEVLSSGVPQSNLIIEAQAAGATRLLRAAVLPLRNWDDDAEEALVVLEHVTAERAIAPPPALAVISESLENMEAIAWEFDPASRRFVYVNPRAQEWTGFSADVWLNSTSIWADRIHPDDREWVAQALESLVATGTARVFEYRAATASGQALWLREAVRVQRSTDGTARRLYGVALQVGSRRAEIEQDLVAQRMDALSRIAGKISHDFNNALMVLSGYGEEVAAALPPGDPLRSDMNEIVRAAERLSSITRQLSTFARRQAAELELHDLDGFVSSLLPEFTQAAQGKVKLKPALGSGAGQVRIAPKDLERALVQLLRHIVAERAPAGSTVTVESGVDRESSQSWVRFTDAGPVLDPDARVRLFDPFERSTAADDALGLAPVWLAIRGMKGDIRISSEAAQTTFTILLPALAQPEPVAIAPVAAQPEPTPVAEQTILLVEDETGIRSLIRKILVRHGYRVLEAADAEEALRIIREGPARLDLLLTDVMLPHRSGRELSETVRERFPNIRVLFVSGFSDEPVQTLPNTAYLQKPFTLGSLLLKVREMLARK